MIQSKKMMQDGWAFTGIISQNVIYLITYFGFYLMVNKKKDSAQTLSPALLGFDCHVSLPLLPPPPPPPVPLQSAILITCTATQVLLHMEHV